MPYSDAAANAAIELFNELAVSIKGGNVGGPTTLADYQEEWTRPIFGQLDERGLRQYQTAFILEAKKVGKTYWAALLSLMMLSVYGEAGAEVYSLANSKEQAALVFKAARLLVKYSPRLQAIGFDYELDVREATKRITYRPLDATYRALAAEDLTLHGEGPSALIVDELHAMRDRKAINAIRLGMGIWPEPLVVYITNMGAEGEGQPFWEELEYAKGVLEDPDSDPRYFASVVEAPEELSDDELLEEGPHWFQINRALSSGLLEVDYYRTACREAREKPSQRADTLRFFLCRTAQSETAAIDMSAWKACADPGFDEAELLGQRCAVGLDLSTRWDLTSATALFPDGDKIRMLSWSWVPEGMVVQLTEKTKKPLKVWIDDPDIPLRATTGNEINFREIQDFLVDVVAERYDVLGFVYDPKFATETAQNLTERELTMVSFAPSFKTYTEPWESFEADYLSGRLAHKGDPILEWSATSLAVAKDRDQGSKPIKVDRRKTTRRIDPHVAALMAKSLIIHLGPEVEPLTAGDFVYG